MRARRPDPDDLRRAARTLVQTVWAGLVVTVADAGVTLPETLPAALVYALVPAVAAALAWVANEWEDADSATLRMLARLISGWARDGSEPNQALHRQRGAD